MRGGVKGHTPELLLMSYIPHILTHNVPLETKKSAQLRQMVTTLKTGKMMVKKVHKQYNAIQF